MHNILKNKSDTAFNHAVASIRFLTLVKLTEEEGLDKQLLNKLTPSFGSREAITECRKDKVVSVFIQAKLAGFLIGNLLELLDCDTEFANICDIEGYLVEGYNPLEILIR